MNTLQKVYLGIATGILATLPFIMRMEMRKGQPQDTLVDILCRDGYESPCTGDNVTSENMYGYQRKTYQLKDGRLSVMTYSEKAAGFPFLSEVGGPRHSRVCSFDGMDLEDKTPQIIGGKKVVKCKIIDELNLLRHNFSPEELQELESMARTNIKYRSMEKEIIEDVEKNGSMYTPGTRSWISLPTLEKMFPFTKKMFERTVSVRNYKVYPMSDTTSMAVLVDIEGSQPSIFGYYHFCNTPDGKIPGSFGSGINCISFEEYDFSDQDSGAEKAFEDMKEGKKDVLHLSMSTWHRTPIPRKALDKIVEGVRKK